jgi:hypothetical protein
VALAVTKAELVALTVVPNVVLIVEPVEDK